MPLPTDQLSRPRKPHLDPSWDLLGPHPGRCGPFPSSPSSLTQQGCVQVVPGELEGWQKICERLDYLKAGGDRVLTWRGRPWARNQNTGTGPLQLQRRLIVPFSSHSSARPLQMDLHKTGPMPVSLPPRRSQGAFHTRILSDDRMHYTAPAGGRQAVELADAQKEGKGKRTGFSNT